MEKKKTAKSWIVLGLVFIILLFIYAGFSNSRIIQGSYGFEGIVKWFIERKRS
jgi:hypothetical protein